MDGLSHYRRFALPPPPERHRTRIKRSPVHAAREARCAADLASLLRIAVLDGGLSSSKDITGHDRRNHVSAWRKAIFLVAHRRGHSYSLIAALMNRDHATVRHGVHAAARACDEPFSVIAGHVRRLEAA